MRSPSPVPLPTDASPVPQPAHTEPPASLWSTPLFTATHLAQGVLGGILIGVLATGLLLLWLRPAPPPAIVLHPPPTPLPTATALPTPTPAPIVVYVSGAVTAPGLYTLDPSARVGDAILAAGGISAEAAAALVNQAERLWDGAQVHVPAASPQIAQPEPAAGVSGAAPALVTNPVAAGSTSGLINLNTASVDELTSLPGIGPAKASAIVENRPYVSVDDLERVPGIGPKTIEQLRDLVTVQ